MNIVGNIRKQKRDYTIFASSNCVKKRWETKKIMIVHELDND